VEFDNEKLSQFFQHRIATLEEQIRQFEQGFMDCINTDQNDTAAAIFSRMAARRLELTQLIAQRERLQAAR
jgi:ferritin-like metal-binding protein YciE